MAASSNPHWIAPDVKFDALTIGPRHHFIASHQCPWDENNRDVLAMEASFADRMPTDKEALTLGLIPYGTRRFEAFDKSYAWNWQEGAMLQWLPQSGRRVIYNQRANNRVISAIRDLESGAVRTLPMPVHAVSSQGDYAISLHKEGLYRLDLASGAWKQLLSLQGAAELQNTRSISGTMHSFDQIQINPSGLRFAVLHLWQMTTSNTAPRGGGLITLNADGSEPFVLEGEFFHFAWVNETQLIGWGEDAQNERRCFLLDDRSKYKELIGENILDSSSAITFSPDRKWLLTETHSDKADLRTLHLWQWPQAPCVEIGRFHTPPKLNRPLRCALHPRWNRDGTKICIDSAHTGTRQIYVVDVSQITQG